MGCRAERCVLRRGLIGKVCLAECILRSVEGAQTALDAPAAAGVGLLSVNPGQKQGLKGRKVGEVNSPSGR